MKSVGIHEAKTHFSSLLRAVEDGEEVVVRRGATPVAVIRRYEPAQKRRRPGRLRGQIVIADDFDSIPPEFADYLE